MHRALKLFAALVVVATCAACQGRINPIDALPGSEYYVGEYPNVGTHPSKPPRAHLTPQELEAARSSIKSNAAHKMRAQPKN